MRNTATLLSTIALLLLLAVPQAMAATTASCQDAAKTSVTGTIKTDIHYPTGTWLFIDAPSLDCKTVTILVKKAGKCTLGSTITAKGTLSKPDPRVLYAEWHLSDKPGVKGKKHTHDLKYEAAFSCKGGEGSRS
jgi:hypothetical protein